MGRLWVIDAPNSGFAFLMQRVKTNRGHAHNMQFIVRYLFFSILILSSMLILSSAVPHVRHITFISGTVCFLGFSAVSSATKTHGGAGCFGSSRTAF